MTRRSGNTDGSGDSNDPHDNPQPFERMVSGNRIIAVVAIVFVVLFLVDLTAARHNRRVARQDRVDAAFVVDPVRSTQTWQLTATGAVWRIESRTADPRAAAMVRRYLRVREKHFFQADYSDPQFHGRGADGRADLQTGARYLAIHFENVPRGAQLTWRAERPPLVDAIHAWANALITVGPARIAAPGTPATGLESDAGANPAAATTTTPASAAASG